MNKWKWENLKDWGKHENVLNDGNKIFFKMCKTLKRREKQYNESTI